MYSTKSNLNEIGLCFKWFYLKLNRTPFGIEQVWLNMVLTFFDMLLTYGAILFLNTKVNISYFLDFAEEACNFLRCQNNEADI